MPNGFFSLLVHRAILFRTAYLSSRTIPETEKRVMFTGPKDFYDHLERLQQRYPRHIRNKEWFFCNKNAISLQSLDRSIYAADAAWEFANHPVWRALVDNGLPLGFDDARAALHKIDTTSENRISAFGTLTRYLALADLCSHGVVSLPTAEDMGYTVASLASGAHDGLSVCGLLPARIKTKHSKKGKGKEVPGVGKEQVKDAFVVFYERVRDELAQTDLPVHVWNTVVAEHTLCKILRLQKLL